MSHKKCIVFNCKGSNETSNVKTINYHRFPTNLAVRLKWKEALNNHADLHNINRDSRICSLHFDKKYHYTACKRRMLSKGAIPTIFDDSAYEVIPISDDAITKDVPNLITINNLSVIDQTIDQKPEDPFIEIKQEPFDEIKPEINEEPIDELKEEPTLEFKEEPIDIVMEELNVKEEMFLDSEPLVPMSARSPEPQVPIRSRIAKLEQNLDTRCAVCLTNQSSHNIYEIQYESLTILKMLQLVTGYKIALEERTRLTGICDVCYEELWICNNYREKFLKSQKILKLERVEGKIDQVVDHDNEIHSSDDADIPDTYEATEPNVPSDAEIEIEPLPEAADDNKTELCPLDCFEHFMGDVLDQIAEYTNEEIKENIKNAYRINRFVEETCKDELRAFVGMLAFSASVKHTNLRVDELYGRTFLGKMYKAVISFNRFKYLSNNIKFYDIKSLEKNVDAMPFARFMRDFWNSLMDKCKKDKKRNASVTRIEHYLMCETHCPFRRYRPNKFPRHGIKMVSHFDSTNKVLLNAYPVTGDSLQESDVFEKCSNAATIRSFGTLWSGFCCAQKSNRWSMLLFYAMLNIAFINAYAMYCARSTSKRKKKVSKEEFLKELADQLVRPWFVKKQAGCSTYSWKKKRKKKEMDEVEIIENSVKNGS